MIADLPITTLQPVQRPLQRNEFKGWLPDSNYSPTRMI